jgi:uncharacterized membrane protein YdjX (TVP38/TMEM64 family)
MTEAPDKQVANEQRSSGRPLLLVSLVLATVVVVWRFTPLAALLDRRHLAELGRTLAASPRASWLVLGGYVGLGLLFFPMTPLLAATALVFEPWRALGLGLTGALTSAAVGYALGRAVARWRPRWVEGERFAPLRARLRRRGILTMAVSRLVPAGNFTLANVLAGAIGIPVRDFMLGNALGILPGLLALTLLSEQLRRIGWSA